jgi:peptidoglycan/xylan/chitin deacetylase (PgdA/CDA1 family)
VVLPLGRARFVVGLLLGLAIVAPSTAGAGTATHARVFVPVLIMHHVKPDKPTDDATERGLTIPPARFTSDIAYLASHHYHSITARTLVSYLRYGGKLPSKPVVLTFDDGYADMYSYVYPVLRTYHMRATFFVIAGLVGTPRYLTWPQVISLDRHGMDIEAHTMTHPDLTIVPRAQVWGEVDRSRMVLQSRLHHSVVLFAYPYGSYNALVLQDVQKAGYWAAFTTHQGWWQQASRLLTLPRVYVDRDDSIPILAGRLVGDPTVLAEDPT